MQIISIGCPHCGAVLSVSDIPGINSKMVTCPICKQKSLIGNCRRIQPSAPSQEEELQVKVQKKPATHHPAQKGDATMLGGSVPTPAAQQKSAGLYCPVTGQRWRLQPGRNIIGRASSSNEADIPIHTGNKRISRQHLVADVRISNSGAPICQLSLAKEHVNDTSVNHSPLLYGDCIILNLGDVIHLPDLDLVFE